ncbi:hypothetical protein G3A41_38120 [Paraburkholderia aspalathi]|nr:hypothetical protein [Paraburkholderia aspalathi]MBK3835853.1 hypothetical protein [Paraburkholderia aspalathi]MBK3865626.1 hypothetical protein [Paraburkholderia aspalathi]
MVSRNLKRAVSAKRVAPTLQAAVEKWRGAEQRMKELSTRPQRRRCDERIRFRSVGSGAICPARIPVAGR